MQLVTYGKKKNYIIFFKKKKTNFVDYYSSRTSKNINSH